MPRTELDALTGRRFRTGRLCLDFVHTGGVGRWQDAELIHDADDLGAWLAFVLDLPRMRAVSADLAPARALREAIWQLTQQQLAGRTFDPASVDVVNAAAKSAPPVPRLITSGRCDTWPADVPAMLSTLARDAISLFGGPTRDRLRGCAATDCELLFFDNSRPGRRRWCSMERCGTKAKMRDYRTRHRDDESLHEPSSPQS